MKKLIVYIMTALLSLTFIPTQLKAGVETTPVSIVLTKPVESAEANVLLARLNEIKGIDKSKLNSHEKKQLRKEVRSIRSQLKTMGGGVYLSVGAIIIIILLLILLL